MNLHYLALFLQIIEKGSLAAAGREMGLSPTTVSERLAALEKHYGVTLVHRTTRAISLTEEGRTLMDGARHLLSEADDLETRVRLGAETLSGLIRMTAPIDIGYTTVKPVVDDFLAANPKVSIELQLSDGYVNIVDEGIDIAVRYGSLGDSSLRVRNLGRNQRVVCAAPDYLQQHGSPHTPTELQQHNCLLMRFGQQLDNVWQFQDNEQQLEIIVSGDRIANDGRLVRDWCLSGQGIMLRAFWDVAEDLTSGRLVRLLEDFTPPPAIIQMLFPPSRSQPRRVRELADALVQQFEAFK